MKDDVGFNDLIIEFARGVVLNKGRAFFVGGVVRDRFLGVESKDVDIEVYGLSLDILKMVVRDYFPDFGEIGVSFGVLHCVVGEYSVDISLPRMDNKVGVGHRGFDVEVFPELGFENALRRRDFTVNAMLLDILSDELIDPFGGRDDLDDGLLRMVDGDTFVEDPLRVLRGMQFVSRFGFEVDGDTKAKMVEMVGGLGELSEDRRREEWRKLLFGRTPSLGLRLGLELGVFSGDVFLELEVFSKMKDTSQEPKFHPEGDVFEHTIMAVDVASKIVRKEKFDEKFSLGVLLGTLCHDFGKVDTTCVVDGLIRAHGHADAGVKYVSGVLGELGFSSYVKTVEPLVKFHMMPKLAFINERKGDGFSDGEFRRLSRFVYPATLRMLTYVSEADYDGRDFVDGEREYSGVDMSEYYLNRAGELWVVDGPPEHCISGGALIKLGLKPGPQFGLLILAADELNDLYDFERGDILKRILEVGDLVLEEKGVEGMVKILLNKEAA